MRTNPVTIKQARRDMRWSLWQADSTATHRERHQQIEKIISRIGRAATQTSPLEMFEPRPNTAVDRARGAEVGRGKS